MKRVLCTTLSIILAVTAMLVFISCNKPQTDLDFSEISMNCLGDSTTYGYVPGKGGQMTNPWPKQLGRYLGLKACRNYGVSGATLSYNDFDREVLAQSYSRMSNDAQIVVLMGGCNDFQRSLSLGQMGDTDITTVYGALEVLAVGLRNKYPDAFVFFMTPFPVGDNFPTENEQGYTLSDLAEAVRLIAQKHNLPLWDMFVDSNFQLEMNTDASDGDHPSEQFLRKYTVPQIARFLEEHYAEILGAKTK